MQFCGSFVLCSLLTLTTGIDSAAAPHPILIAGQMLDDLQAVTWGVNDRTWRAAQAGARCDPKRSNGGLWAAAEEEWSFRCRHGEASSHRTVEAFFYNFELKNPFRSRLLQFHTFSTGLPPDAVADVHRILTEHLTALHGPFDAPVRRIEGARNSVARDVRRWRAGDIEIHLYRAEASFFLSGDESGSVVLLARHRRLLDAMAEDAKLRELDRRPVTERDAALLKRLRELMPPAADLVSAARGYVLQQKIHTVLPRVLALAATAEESDVPVLWLAADRLASWLQLTERREVSDSLHEGDERTFYGLEFEWSELGNSWAYRHNLLKQVWEQYGNTPWAERAFVQLTWMGWNAGSGCQAGGDLFRLVIPAATSFLASRPHSPYALEIRFALALGYDTWWSLTQASPEDLHADHMADDRGAEAARREAIRHYREVNRAAPGSLRARYAARHLPRLMSRVDTAQRRFRCIYD
jgi:hypothetical protein